MDEVNIKDNTKIGNHVIINNGCIIDEDVIVEDYVNLLQSSSLGKLVKLDSLTSIGKDILVIPKICIGKKSIIKNSSIVIEDVGDNCIMEGTPAKIGPTGFLSYFNTSSWIKLRCSMFSCSSRLTES